MAQNSFIKYSLTKRLYKPSLNKGYTIANIKYIIEKKGVNEISFDKKLKSSIEYFFNSVDNFNNYLKR